MYRRLGLRTNLCIMICLLAETYFMAGQYEKGMQQANLAIDTSSEIGDRWCLPRIHTIRARLLQTFREIDAAEASRIGLVSSVVPDDELPRAAQELALRIAANPLSVLRRSKRCLMHAREADYATSRSLGLMANGAR